MAIAFRPVEAVAPATTANLGPGFDCLGLALKLHNRVRMIPEASQPLIIAVVGNASADSVPLDSSNLVYRAASRVFDLVGQRPERLSIELELGAPLARGLGSSASAIVGGMAAANALLGNPIPKDGILSEMVAMEGHPDNVAPCFLGGLVASLTVDGREEIIRTQPHADVRFVVLIPDYELSTAKARQAIPKSIPLKDAVFNLSRTPFVLDRLKSGNLEGLSDLMDDRLHQPYRKPLIKGYDAIAASAMESGAAAVCISGAGPSILAVAHQSVAQCVADSMASANQSVGAGGSAKVLEAESEGVRLRDLQ
jgi:homoserine kinase